MISQNQGSMTQARDGEANRKRRAESSRHWSRARILDQIPQMTQIIHEWTLDWHNGSSIAVHTSIRRLVAEQLGRLLLGISPGAYLDDFIIYLNTTIANTLLTESNAPDGFDAPAYQRAVERVNEFGRQAYEAHLTHPQPNGKPDMIDEESRKTMITFTTLGELSAFGAGILSFLAPCVLPLVPSYLSYLAGVSLQEPHPQVPFNFRVSFHALWFVVGFAVLFTGLGTVTLSRRAQRCRKRDWHANPQHQATQREQHIDGNQHEKGSAAI